MIYIFIFLLVCFIIIGFFIFIFVGVFIFQAIIRRHIHILEKWNLTKEYIVKDLAPDALPLDSSLFQQGQYQRTMGLDSQHSSNDLESNSMIEFVSYNTIMSLLAILFITVLRLLRPQSFLPCIWIEGMEVW
jgi:hypothetical protein